MDAEAPRARRVTRSVRRLVGAAAILLAAIVAVAAATSVGGVLALSQSRHRQSTVLNPAAATVGQLLDDYLNQETGVRGYVLTGDGSYLQPYTAATRRIPRDVAALQRDATTIAGAPSQLQTVVAAHQSWLAMFAEPALQDVESGQADVARTADFQAGGKSSFDALRSSLGTLRATVNSAVARNQRQTDQRESLLWVLLGGSLLALLLGGLAVVLFVRRFVVSPLEVLRARVRAVVTAGFDQPVAGSGPVEIVDLAHDIEAMRSRLVEEIDRAQRAVDALTQEGPAVTALRRALSPRIPSLPSTEISGRLVPAAGLLAGDWFDVLALPGERVGLVIGDVSGHGAAAGVYALELKHLISSALRAGLSPGDALEATVRQLTGSTELFATAFVAVIEGGRGSLSYANAGHPEGLIISVGDRDSEVVSLVPTGPLMSEIVGDASWTTRECRLQAGDTIVVVTDGIVEARDPQGAEFGMARLKDLCRGASDEAVTTLAEGIVAAVAGFSGDRQPDDRTVLICRHSPEGWHPGDQPSVPEAVAQL